MTTLQSPKENKLQEIKETKPQEEKAPANEEPKTQDAVQENANGNNTEQKPTSGEIKQEEPQKQPENQIGEEIPDTSNNN